MIKDHNILSKNEYIALNQHLQAFYKISIKDLGFRYQHLQAHYKISTKPKNSKQPTKLGLWTDKNL